MIGLILALSAGGIFYMLFYDMIPKAHKAEAGFLLLVQSWAL